MRNESSKTITKSPAGGLPAIAGGKPGGSGQTVGDGRQENPVSTSAQCARRAPLPGAGDSPESSPIVPFSVLYVYDKENDWIKVGYDSFGKTAGWVKRDKAITWNQALTVSFKDPQDIQRVMMFNSKDDLQKLVNDYDKKGYQALYDAVVSGSIPERFAGYRDPAGSPSRNSGKFLPGADHPA